MTQPAYVFPIGQTEVYTEFRGARVPVAGRTAVVRLDTGEPLAIVGSRYAPVPHEKVIDLADQALTSLGLQRSMDVRLPGNGSKMFCHMRLEEKALAVGDPKVNDIVSLEIVAKNSLDGTSPVSLEIVGRRLLCKNGLTVNAKLLQFRKVHTKHLELGSLAATVERAISYFQFEAIPFWNSLTQRHITDEAGAAFIVRLGEQGVLPQRYAEMAAAQWDEAPERSVWQLLNAVTYVLTHEVEPKSYLRARTIGLAVDREFRALPA